VERNTSLESAFHAHRQRVWAIVYRMTGSAADADDLVQDAFAKALVDPPSGELGPWLARVAVNAGIDVLRKRRRTAYVGPWLPEPIDTGDDAADLDSAAPDHARAATDVRYDMLESASFAFLIALEALSPKARAVLLLRDVFDYSVRETADLLAMSETHVKVTHHRARRVMATYDAARTIPTRELQSRARDALAALMAALVSGDVTRVETMLAEDVRTLNDSAGKHTAARVPIHGRAKVALFWTKISQHEDARVELRMLNGLPAVLVTLPHPPKNVAPRTALLIDVDARGLVRSVHGIVAPQKLERVFRAQ
jgi:RNA polymerase sigma-70 factor (ECF subfamily)